MTSGVRSSFSMRSASSKRSSAPDQDVDRGVTLARRYEPELLIGLGGGSAMDCAKGINFLYSNGGRMQDYWGIGKAQRPMLPMIAVPDHGRHWQRNAVICPDFRCADRT